MPIFPRARPIEWIERRRGRLWFQNDVPMFEKVGIVGLFDIVFLVWRFGWLTLKVVQGGMRLSEVRTSRTLNLLDLFSEYS